MSEYNELKTSYIKEEVLFCGDVDELKETVFPRLCSQKEDWTRKINEIFSDSKTTKVKFAEKCRVSRVTLNKWLVEGRIPKSRGTFLRIGMAAGYNVEQMNRFLQRYGRYTSLYSKSLEDCVCIYVLNHDYGDETVDKYEYILDKIKGRILRNDRDDEVEDISTVKFDAKLFEVQDEDELEQFIEENSSVFANAYHKLYAYIKINLEANCDSYEYQGVVSRMAEEQQWSASLKNCVSAIRQNQWYPTRNKIISLGLHLNMDHEQVNEMLELAHMEPLCAKNVLECVIMFVLESAEVNEILLPDNTNTSELCRYAREVFEELNLSEIGEFISELPEGDEDDEDDGFL